MGNGVRLDKMRAQFDEQLADHRFAAGDAAGEAEF
jgi:hypothetical protein